MLLSILSFILVFCTLVLFHEFGHFAAAKLNGIYVHEFSIGMGPKLLKKQGKETLYTIRAFPIGGFVNMEGEDEKSDHPRSFSSKSPLRKLSVLVAGPFMNFILAMILLFVLFITLGFPTNIMGEITPDSPAFKAGIETNDRIVAINGVEITNWDDIISNISDSKSSELIKIDLEKNDGSLKTISLIPMLDEETGRSLIGIRYLPKKDIGKSAYFAITNVGNISKEIVTFLVSMPFKGVSDGDVVGPVGMYKMIGSAAQSGILDLLSLGALISINLGIFNLLPFPALDGGRIVFILIEFVRGKPLNEEVEGKIHFIGFAILITLMILLVFKDVLR
ncbi:MAG: RIP metalloprotease RseP [Acidaminobacteraceae bacterium]